MSNLEDFVAAGYFLTRPLSKPGFLADDPLPHMIISASNCMGGMPGIVHWAGGEPEKLGVPENRIEALDQWADLAFEKVFGYPDTFYRLSAAREFVSQFIPEPPDDLMILCVALRRDIVEEFIAYEKEHSQKGQRGIYETLILRQSPVAGGVILGYEPLGYNYDLDHTWLCYGLHKEAAKKWNIQPNALGFLDRDEDAQKVADLANEDMVGDCWWLPWLILRYSLNP